jgi:hypothetical protein
MLYQDPTLGADTTHVRDKLTRKNKDPHLSLSLMNHTVPDSTESRHFFLRD